MWGDLPWAPKKCDFVSHLQGHCAFLNDSYFLSESY